MINSISKLVHTIALPTIFAASLILSALPTDAFADGWELRTTADEVPGTREIESGDIEKAIRISNVQLPRVSPEYKVAVLTNLCKERAINESVAARAD